jgi:hypothetical protein
MYKQENCFLIYLYLDLETQVMHIIRVLLVTSSNNKANKFFENETAGLFVLNSGWKYFRVDLFILICLIIYLIILMIKKKLNRLDYEKK